MDKSNTFNTMRDTSRTAGPALSVGGLKIVSDSLTVLEMKLRMMLRSWYWYLVGSLVFPVSIFYWSRALAPDDPDALRRVMTGTIVMGVSIMTTGMLGQQLIQDRFQGRLKLMITMPMSKVAYFSGVLAFAVLQAAFTVALLLGFARVAGVDFEVTWAFILIAVPVLLTMAGLTLLIVTFAPSAEVGGIMTNLFGVLLVMISPVFFTMERAPLVLQWLGWVSPLRYAADGISKSLSGQTDVWLEFGILAGFSMAATALGLLKLKWREA